MKPYVPRILVFDIENFPLLIHAWTVHEAEAIKVERHAYLASIAWSWYPEDKIHVRSLRSYPGYNPKNHDDKALIEELWGLFDRADTVVGQNSDNFDIKLANLRFLYHGLGEPSPFSTVDILKINRTRFRHPSNKLDEVAQYHGIGRKLPHTGKNLWFGCQEGDEKSWRLMEKYNQHDVYLTRKIYDLVKPWAKPSQHPNLNVLTGDEACTVCQGKNFHKHGWWISKGGTTEYQRLECTKCGHWNRGPLQRIDKKVGIKSL